MANKQALREFQSRLAERLTAARAAPTGRSWLAVEAGGQGFLLPLTEAGEIFSVTKVQPVAHCRDWFLGVANLRGHLHGVVDLGRFLGLSTPPEVTSQERPQGTPQGTSQMTPQMTPGGRVAAQWIGFNAAFDVNCVLRVDRLVGLRNDAQWGPAERTGSAGAANGASSPSSPSSPSPPPPSAARPAFAGVQLRDADGRVWQELRLAALARDATFLSVAV